MVWSRKFGQGFKLGSCLRRTDRNDRQTEEVFGGFTAKVALEALRGELTTTQLATKRGTTPHKPGALAA
jgi:hypothetical protein